MPPQKDRTVSKAKKGSGLQRRYGGKMGARHKTRGGYVVVPRSNSAQKGKAAITFEWGQPGPKITKEVPSRCRTSMPHGCTRYSRPVHPISESGDWWPILGS